MNVMLTTKEVAQRLRLTVRTLEKWRVAGKGPKYHKAGLRVLYDPDEVEAWLKNPQTERESGEMSNQAFPLGRLLMLSNS